MYENAKDVAERNQSKFLFTSQDATQFSEKYMAFIFKFMFAAMTAGLTLYAAAKTTTPVYHGYIFIKGGPNEITDEVYKKYEKASDVELENAENPELLIFPNKRTHLLFTDKNLYYQLWPKAGTFSMADAVSGVMPISEIQTLNTNGKMNGMLELTINNNMLGACESCNFPRMKLFLNKIDKDLRSTKRENS
jgi:hypothetical protein